jgi:hypothetical protein
MGICSIGDCNASSAARGWCTKHWARWRHHGDPNVVLKPGPKRGICSIDGCRKPHRAKGYCQAHYLRFIRYGDPLLITRRSAGSGSIHGGYIRIYQPEHSLASSKGYVYAHRIALFDAIGDGEHLCWICGRMVTWDHDYPRHSDGLVVDHLDRDRLNNNPKNLRPSCGYCNLHRH